MSDRVFEVIENIHAKSKPTSGTEDFGTRKAQERRQEIQEFASATNKISNAIETFLLSGKEQEDRKNLTNEIESQLHLFATKTLLYEHANHKDVLDETAPLQAANEMEERYKNSTMKILQKVADFDKVKMGDKDYEVQRRNLMTFIERQLRWCSLSLLASR